MLRLVLGIALFAALAGTVSAEEGPRQTAINAAAMQAVLAFDCGDQQDKDETHRIGLLTLIAGGFSENEASAQLSKVHDALTTAERKSLPKSMCRSMLKNIIENNEAFRAKLSEQGKAQ